ncbi:MAG: hypothetical protein ACO307_12545 [Ilumatobacteraceae bacterium]
MSTTNRPAGRRRSVRVLFAVVVVAVSIAPAMAAWYAAIARPAQNVERLSRAAIGCTTTLEFAVTGTFYVFEERGTDGAAVPDGCVAMPSGGDVLDVEVTDGSRTLAIRDDRSASYDLSGPGGATATSLGRFEIDRVGRYEITAIGPDADVVVAIGRSPDRGVAALRAVAVALLGCGLVVAGLVLVHGRRRVEPTVTSTTWAPPSGPPLG